MTLAEARNVQGPAFPVGHGDEIPGQNLTQRRSVANHHLAAAVGDEENETTADLQLQEIHQQRRRLPQLRTGRIDEEEDDLLDGVAVEIGAAVERMRDAVALRRIGEARRQVGAGIGRAGGGAELGGVIGMMPYLQRSAIQASASVLAAIEAL